MASGVLEQKAADPSAGLHACVDSLARVEVDRLSERELIALLASLTRAQSRIGALRLRVLAAADRRQVASTTGASCTGAWAAQIVNGDSANTQRQVELAQGLATRTATQRALAEGLISADHAAVIVRALQDLPDDLDVAAREEVERSLLDKARTSSPRALRRAARRALEAVQPDPVVVDEHENEIVVSEEERARTRVRLSLHDNGDGTTSGHFTVPTLHGDLLRKIIETMTAPRRGRLGATEAQAGAREARTDWGRARGEALCALIERLPTDHLHPRTAATVVVTMTEESLRERLQVAGLDTGEVISAGEARRLACGAGIVPAVLGGGSLPLDLGRAKRLFNEAQRTALGLKQKTCAADGCDRPYAWCELHHEHAWSRGGRTDLARAIGLCHFHHQRVHDRGFRHSRGPDGSITFHRRT